MGFHGQRRLQEADSGFMRRALVHVMKASLVTFRVLAFILMAVLAGMMMLSWSARMPCLEISSLPGLDDGQTVLVRGLLVDLRVNGGGSESLILADREGAASGWVFVSQAIS